MKVLDPVTAPLVANAFVRFATGTYTKGALIQYLHAQGLRARGGSVFRYKSLDCMLRNRFYTGQLKLGFDPTIYPGRHQPLIGIELFDQVQGVLDRKKARPARQHHSFTYSRLIRCGGCDRVATGERTKGHVYYRCHSCPGSSLREERIEEAIGAALPDTVSIGPGLDAAIEGLRDQWCARAVRRRLGGQISDHLHASLSRTGTVQSEVDRRTDDFAAFARSPQRVFLTAKALQRREFTQLMVSISMRQKQLTVSFSAPFS